jgi:hypothetical protein
MRLILILILAAAALSCKPNTRWLEYVTRRTCPACVNGTADEPACAACAPAKGRIPYWLACSVAWSHASCPDRLFGDEYRCCASWSNKLTGGQCDNEIYPMCGVNPPWKDFFPCCPSQTCNPLTSDLGICTGV